MSEFIKIHLRTSQKARTYYNILYNSLKQTEFVDMSDLCKPASLFDENQWKLEGHSCLRDRLEEAIKEFHKKEIEKIPTNCIARHPFSMIRGQIDFSDLTGQKPHWFGLAIDIPPKAISKEPNINFDEVVEIMLSAGFQRDLTAMGETWHFSVKDQYIREYYEKEGLEWY